jgi:uncharacterized peroxidase-related enzyme
LNKSQIAGLAGRPAKPCMMWETRKGFFMARLTTIDPATATGAAKELFDGPLKTMRINIFKGMASSPAALSAYLGLTGALKDTSLTAGEREVIQLAISEINGCDYCLAAHTVIGKGAGLTEAQTIAARKRSFPDDAKLQALTHFAVTLHEKKGHVSDADLQAFKAAGYTDAAVVEVIAVYAAITFTNFFNHVNETAVDFPAPPSL